MNATAFPDDGPWRDIERMQRAMRNALGVSSAEQMRRITEQITGAAKTAKLAEQIAGMPQMRDLSRHFSQSEDFQRIAKQIAGGNMQRITEQVAATWRPQMLGLNRQLADVFRVQPGWSRMSEPLRIFQEVAVAAEAPAEEAEEEQASLGRWLASLPAATQLALLVAGLQVLDTVNNFIETTTGQDIPDPLQSATRMCFAVVAFLLLYMQERDDSRDDE